MQTSLLGFDLVRLVAAATIAFGHLWTIHELSGDRPLSVGPLQISWLGVAALLGISGYFAFAPGAASTGAWLGKRALRIIVPYWMTLAVLYIANPYFHRHPTPVDSVLAHVAGLAAFTHPESLLATHLWFISVILVCYVLAALLRRLPMALVVAAVAVIWWEPHGPTYAAWFLCFLAGGALRLWKHAAIPVAIVGLGIALGWLRHPDYWYSVAAVLAVWAVRNDRTTGPPWVARAARGSYEFYLVHPLAFLAGAEIAELGFGANLVFGTALAALLTAVFVGMQRLGEAAATRRRAAPIVRIASSSQTANEG